MRYKIPEEDYNRLTAGISLSTPTEYLKGYYILSRPQDLRHYMSSLDKRAHNLFGAIDFNSWVDLYTEYPYRLFGLITQKTTHNIYDAPLTIDFKTQLDQKLQKKLLPKVKGKPTSVEYYETKTPLVDSANNIVTNFLGQPLYEYKNLIARIDFDFKFDAFGFIEEKIAKLRWYKEDGKLSAEYKDLGKIFDPINDHEARIAEGKIRRESIINGLQLPVMDMLVKIYTGKEPIEILSIGRAFLDYHDEVFRDFIDKSLSITDPNHAYFGKKVAWVAIKDYAEQGSEWLDFDIGDGETIRQHILTELDI